MVGRGGREEMVIVPKVHGIKEEEKWVWEGSVG